MAGELWSWGKGGYVHGTGVLTDVLTPQHLGTKSWAKVLFAGTDAAFGIDDAGALYAWGRGDWYTLGFNDGQLVQTPRLLSVGPWVDIAVSGESPYSMLGVKADGSLWGWGNNVNGSLGLPPGEVLVPTRVGMASDWLSVSVTVANGAAIKQDGTLWTWGYGGWGALGTGSTADRAAPAQTGADSNWQKVVLAVQGSGGVLGLKTDGRAYYWGSSFQAPTPPGSAAHVLSPFQLAGVWADIAIGNSSALLVKADGTLWAWGTNGEGELGDGTLTPRDTLGQVGVANTWVSAHASGHDFSFGIRADGTLWAWGSGDNGTLGLGGVSDMLTPQQVGGDAGWSSVFAGYRSVSAVKGSLAPPPPTQPFWEAFQKAYEVL